MDTTQEVLTLEAMAKSLYLYAAELASKLKAEKDQREINQAWLAEEFKKISQKKEEQQAMPRPLKYGQGSIKRRTRANTKGGFYSWYEARYCNEFGARKTKVFKTATEAYNFLRKQNPSKAKPRRRLPIITLYSKCVEYIERHKKGLVSYNDYLGVLKNHLCELTQDIKWYTKDWIYDWLKSRTGCQKLCYTVLKNVFANEADNPQSPLYQRNILANLQKPKMQTIEGRWFTIEEQSLILENKHKSGMADEIDFYLMTGCRLSEAYKVKPYFDKDCIYVNRTKRDGTSGYSILSKAYCTILKEKWPTMFKLQSDTYSKKFSDFLASLGIKHPDTSLHSLRHTFCSNLYYLGAPIKLTQYLMGHKTAKMTQDLYTTYDPTVTGEDVRKLYGDLYPSFDGTDTANIMKAMLQKF